MKPFNQSPFKPTRKVTEKFTVSKVDFERTTEEFGAPSSRPFHAAPRVVECHGETVDELVLPLERPALAKTQPRLRLIRKVG